MLFETVIQKVLNLNLASEEGFLESPNPTGFKITMFNSNPDIVMVGCRVHVGNTSPSHIPCELAIFQRTIKMILERFCLI